MTKSIFDTGWTKCAHTHKPMPITTSGGGLKRLIYGGAAGSPVYKDCDIFVALDGSTHEDRAFYPWNDGEKKIFISFYITDMQVPKDREEFRKMIDWLAGMIIAGKKVHVGCMGGHGRTGLVLAALVRVLTGEVDAISYVRKNYCSKAVETMGQVDFLNKEFGVKKVGGTKDISMMTKGGQPPVNYYTSNFNSKYGPQSQVTLDYIEIEPLTEGGSIWFPKGEEFIEVDDVVLTEGDIS